MRQFQRSAVKANFLHGPYRRATAEPTRASTHQSSSIYPSVRMKPKKLAALLVALVFSSSPTSFAQSELREQLASRVANAYSQFEPLYKQLNAHPELSLQEEKNSTRLADELEKLGFNVARRVGGYGVVGVLKNGNGPTV